MGEIEEIEMRTNIHIKNTSNGVEIIVGGMVDGRTNPTLARIMLREMGVEEPIIVRRIG